jgi:plastocyanin
VRLRTAILSSALGGLAVVGPAVPASAGTNVTAPIKISVVAREWSFTLSKQTVKVGSTVIFTVKNKGQIAHNLVFTTIGKRTPLIKPGQSATLRIVFRKKGRYPYICSVTRHAERGMAGSFVVRS